MSNNKNDVVIIELDKPRELRYGYKAIKRLVAMTDKGIEEISEFNFGAEDLELIEKVIYCGLLSDAQKNGEKLKLEDMEDLIDLKPLEYTMNKMSEAFTIAFGEPEDTKETEDSEKNEKRIAQEK